MAGSPPTISAAYVVDTHALIWYLLGDKKLSAHALVIFQAAERGETQLVVPAIVIAELYYADKKHRLFANFDKEYTTLKAKPYFLLVDFNPDAVLDFEKDNAVPEMHDRIIVGLARRLGVPLITLDPQITAAKVVTIAW